MCQHLPTWRRTAAQARKFENEDFQECVVSFRKCNVALPLYSPSQQCFYPLKISNTSVRLKRVGYNFWVKTYRRVIWIKTEGAEVKRSHSNTHELDFNC